MGSTQSIDQAWECPRCRTQVGMGSPGKLLPPTCRMGHEPVEMEQVNVSRMGRQFEDGEA